mmetsp:Transcript_4756/g.11468  ORF Transcript_4756/g.11468 Transcript_4756/m.11468 type:complete len:242 (+) Transcript_4756:258-983(+)
MSSGASASSSQRFLRLSRRTARSPISTRIERRWSRLVKVSTGPWPSSSRSAHYSLRTSTCASQDKTVSAVPSPTATPWFTTRSQASRRCHSLQSATSRQLSSHATHLSPSLQFSASSSVIRWSRLISWCCGRRSSGTSQTRRSALSTSSSHLASRSGCGRRASYCCSPTAMTGRAPSTRRRALNVFCKCPTTTPTSSRRWRMITGARSRRAIGRLSTAPHPQTTSTSSAARSTATSANHSS